MEAEVVEGAGRDRPSVEGEGEGTGNVEVMEDAKLLLGMSEVEGLLQMLVMRAARSDRPKLHAALCAQRDCMTELRTKWCRSAVAGDLRE